jgi:hypothetical protein
MRLTSWVGFSSVVVLSAGTLAAACANSNADGFGNADAGDPDGNGAFGTGATNGSSGGADGADGADANPVVEGGTTTSTSGGSVDAAADVVVTPPSDAGPGVNTTTSLQCGMSATCALPSQLCCIVGATAYSCTTGTTCPNVNPSSAAPGSAALACDNSSNCGPGLSCCLDVVAGQSVSSCKASCAASHAQLCAAFTADPGCPSGVSCSASHINEFGLSPFFYATCGGVKN